MTVMDAEVFDAFRSIGVPDDKASAAAQAMNKQYADLGTMKADVATLKIDVGVLKVDVGALKVDMALLKWMVGFMFAGVLGLVLKAFVH